MTGVHEADTLEGSDPATTIGDDAVAVDWNVRIRHRLRGLGLAASVTGTVDVVVVDRRGHETTPPEPGDLIVEGRRVVVVPDRSDGAPPVEIWVGGDRARHGPVVRVLRRTVALDSSVDAAFESARRRRRPARGDGTVRADGGRSVTVAEPPTSGLDAVESVALELAVTEVSLAVGGFAAAVDPLR
jgi:hypothetical protein